MHAWIAVDIMYPDTVVHVHSLHGVRRLSSYIYIAIATSKASNYMSINMMVRLLLIVTQFIGILSLYL